jgi:uncharacterized protein YndB with AHSA1/START domain
MAARSSAAMQPAERELVITRVFDAPRELVWKAWTEPERMARWWGPRGFNTPVCELDVRPGGAIRIVMRGPDGAEHPMTGVFREIVKPERLVFFSAALDEEGKPLFEGTNTVTFSEQGGKTTLTMVARVIKSTPKAARNLDGMEIGWTQSLERLTEYLARA